MAGHGYVGHGVSCPVARNIFADNSISPFIVRYVFAYTCIMGTRIGSECGRGEYTYARVCSRCTSSYRFVGGASSHSGDRHVVEPFKEVDRVARVISST